MPSITIEEKREKDTSMNQEVSKLPLDLRVSIADLASANQDIELSRNKVDWEGYHFLGGSTATALDRGVDFIVRSWCRGWRCILVDEFQISVHGVAASKIVFGFKDCGKVDLFQLRYRMRIETAQR